jgi:hypothetical protein
VCIGAGGYTVVSVAVGIVRLYKENRDAIMDALHPETGTQMSAGRCSAVCYVASACVLVWRNGAYVERYYRQNISARPSAVILLIIP